MNSPETLTDIHDRIVSFQKDFVRLHNNLARVLIGQDEIIEKLIIALLAEGHTLLEGLPGLGKTHLVKALAGNIGVSLSRIQCTPDLMPGDITGSEILLKSVDDEHVRIDFRRGPIFASMLLVDEINRTTPKTQSALLEAMQEKQVTCAGTSHPLPQPFWVIATQNPIELEGTFPLPEAQLDRFLIKLQINYPSADALLDMIDCSLDDEPANHAVAILSGGRVMEMIQEAKNVVLTDFIKNAAISLILATHSERANADKTAQHHIRYGASPRGLQALLKTARIKALSDGRAHVAIDDLEAVALPVLRHRIMLNMESELDNIAADDVLQQIIQSWRNKPNNLYT